MHQIPYTYAHMYPYSSILLSYGQKIPIALFSTPPFYGPEKMWNFPTQP